MSERCRAHHCLAEAIESRKAAIKSERNSARKQHALSYVAVPVGFFYHQNQMDKEATQVIHQTIALPEAITAIVALKCLPIPQG